MFPTACLATKRPPQPPLRRARGPSQQVRPQRPQLPLIQLTRLSPKQSQRQRQPRSRPVHLRRPSQRPRARQFRCPSRALFFPWQQGNLQLVFMVSSRLTHENAVAYDYDWEGFCMLPGRLEHLRIANCFERYSGRSLLITVKMSFRILSNMDSRSHFPELASSGRCSAVEHFRHRLRRAVARTCCPFYKSWKPKFQSFGKALPG